VLKVVLKFVGHFKVLLYSGCKYQPAKQKLKFVGHFKVLLYSGYKYQPAKQKPPYMVKIIDT
jgi:hypothetical protein